jgi:ribosomal protein S18 acetylase RimI-like enzyme
MMNGLATRPATTADAPALVALVNSAYRGDSSKAGWTTEADLLDGQRIDVETLTETIATPGNVILLHVQDHAPLACVHVERTGDDCYVGMLTVRPTAQGSGLGRQLLEAAERWAIEQWSARSMHMTVIQQRIELIAWYERHGYSRTGERKPFPYGDERFGVPRRGDLEFEVLCKPLSAGEPRREPTGCGTI